MGSSLLRRSQVFPEAVYGTAGEATHQLSGVFSPQNSPEQVRREERRASMMGSNTYDFLAYRSDWSYRGRATAQELPFFLSSSIRGDVVPSTPSGAVKLWDYALPLTTIPALKSLCCYAGDNTQALRAAGMFTRRFAIEGQGTAPWMLDADLMGRETVYSGEVFSDPALATIANKTIKNLLTRVYIEDTGSALDATPTAKTSLVYGFRFEFNPGIEPDYTMGIQLDMTDIQRGEPSATLTITAKWHATTVAEFGKWRGDSYSGITQPRFVGLYNEGETISTTYEYSAFLKGAYIITGFEPLSEERNGTMIATVTMALVEDVTWTKALQILVQNTLTATDLPTV